MWLLSVVRNIDNMLVPPRQPDAGAAHGGDIGGAAGVVLLQCDQPRACRQVDDEAGGRAGVDDLGDAPVGVALAISRLAADRQEVHDHLGVC